MPRKIARSGAHKPWDLGSFGRPRALALLLSRSPTSLGLLLTLGEVGASDGAEARGEVGRPPE